MKEIVSTDKEIGSDGLKLGAKLGVEGSDLKAQIEVSYPIAKIIEPATKAADELLDKIEKAIPGDWDKPMIEKFKAEYKQRLVELLSE